MLGLLAWLIHKIELPNLVNRLRHVQLRYFIPVFLLIGAESALRSYNWKLLLRCKGISLSFGQVLYAYLAGAFFGTFIPSSMGVDLTRFLFLRRYKAVRTQDAAVTLLALNVVALLVLCLTVSVSALLLAGQVEFTLWLLLLSGASFCAVLGFCGVYAFQTPIRARLQPMIRGKIPEKIWSMLDAFSCFRSHYALLGKITLFSFVNLILSSLTVYAVSRAVHGDIPLLYFLLLMPVINLTRLIPHSIAGLGGEQGIFVFLFTTFGFREDAVFLMSLLLSASVMLFMMSGGVLYLLRTLAGNGGRSPIAPSG